MLQKILSEKKAQGGLEYIGIIGGAVIVAILVGLALKQIAQTLGERGRQLTQETVQQP